MIPNNLHLYNLNLYNLFFILNGPVSCCINSDLSRAFAWRLEEECGVDSLELNGLAV